MYAMISRSVLRTRFVIFACNAIYEMGEDMHVKIKREWVVPLLEDIQGYLCDQNQMRAVSAIQDAIDEFRRKGSGRRNRAKHDTRSEAR